MRLFLLFVLFCFSFSFSQRQENVDFIKIDAKITPIFESKEIKGEAFYEFEMLNKTDSIFLDAFQMEFQEVLLNGKKTDYTNDINRIRIKAPKKIGRHKLFLKFKNKPSQTVYFINWHFPDSLEKINNNNTISANLSESNSRSMERIKNSLKTKLSLAINSRSSQAWTQGQGKYTSHWLPSIDDMNDKIEFDLTFLVESPFEVVSNGKHLQNPEDSSREFDMTQPMSSYLAAFVIGNFDKKVLKSKSEVPLELYYEPKDSLRFEPTYRYSKEIFDFLEEEIGVDYPWQNYKQIPVQDFLYAGMENTTCTIFSNQFVIDSTAFVDKNYVNINAHELAHQWFGNLVTEVSGEHHWLHEGFATYYAYLTEKELFGDDHFYWKLYDTAKTLHQLSDDDQGEALTDPGAGSLTFYEKGAWALVMLREQVGDANFRKGIQSYLNAYAYKNATIQNFLTHMELASNQDLTSFRKQWLENTDFLWKQVKAFLISKNTSLKIYLEQQENNQDDVALDNQILTLLRKKNVPKQLIRQLIFDYARQLPDSSLEKILITKDLEIRQAVALATPKIPTSLQKEFESLLSDKSYVTQETALFKLWETFPEKRVTYLEQLDGVVGLPNKNVRQLWLTLALITQDFQPERKKKFYDELNSYTASHYNFEVRQLAFQYLSQIQALSDSSLKNLVQALEHHVWQFKKSSRNLVLQLNNTSEGKARFDILKNQLSTKQRSSLKKVINP